MAQEKDDYDLEYTFPDGYEYFAQMANEAARQLKEIDERIKHIPVEDIKQASYRLKFNPAGLEKAREALKNRDNRDDLEQQKKQLEADMLKHMDKGIKEWDVDLETTTQIRNAAIETLHPNPFKGQLKEELKISRGMEKDQQHSQDFMRMLLKNQRGQIKDNKSTIEPERNVNKDTSEMSMSTRFIQTLAFSKTLKTMQSGPDKKPTINTPGLEPDLV